MLINPSLILFFVCLLTSILMILSSPSLLFSWVSLELNTLAFIPMILNSSNKNSSESAIKYFLTQTLASILFLLSTTYPLDSVLNNTLMSIALLIKLGAAPFHSWLPSMVESMSWLNLFILLTIQKINPLLILINPQPSLNVINMVIWLSLIVGSVMGLIQTQIRSLLTYSSINHMGWMLIAWINSNYLLTMYFFAYMLMLLPLSIIFYNSNTSQINQLSNLPLPMTMQFISFILLLSLGGLPPFLGFLPKWMVLQELLLFSDTLETCLLMILTSLLTLFYYLRITFSAFIMSNLKWSTKFQYNFKLSYLFITSASLSILGLSLAFML